MSLAYSLEPNTLGKLIIFTTKGELEVELWPKESPLACRNFVQLAMEGYYNDTIFHRLIPGFILQGGDPTGTGFGGESIYGKPFKDEFHSRLHFTHRGLLAMANTGPHTNTSQFFFTLGPTPELESKNTIFGKVVGDTLFNLLAMGEQEVEDDKPTFPVKINSIKIIANPFDDILPRQKQVQKVIETKVERKKISKNLNLLSFEQEQDIPNIKIKSSHDLVASNVLEAKEMKRSKPTQSLEPAKKPEMESAQLSDSDESEEDRLTALKNQFNQLKRQYKGPKEKPKKQLKKQDSFVSVQDMRLAYLSSGKAVPSKVASRVKKVDDDTVLKLQEFQSELKAAKPIQQPIVENEVECDLHFIKNCESCRDTFGETLEDDEQGWMTATLKFKKPVSANVYEPKVDDYTVFDPRRSDPFGRDLQGSEKAWLERTAVSRKRRD